MNGSSFGCGTSPFGGEGGTANDDEMVGILNGCGFYFGCGFDCHGELVDACPRVMEIYFVELLGGRLQEADLPHLQLGTSTLLLLSIWTKHSLHFQ